MINRIYTINNDKFILSCPEKLILKWNKETHISFPLDFQRQCFTLLWIQKRFRCIDKNIFLLIMQKMSINKFHLIDFEKYPLYKLLYYMKAAKVDVSKDFNKIVLKNLINSTFYIESRNTELFSEKIMGIIEVGIGPEITGICFDVLKNDKVQTIVLGFKFNPFSYKKSHWIKRLSECIEQFINTENTAAKRGELYILKKIKKSRFDTCYALSVFVFTLVILNFIVFVLLEN